MTMGARQQLWTHTHHEPPPCSLCPELAGGMPKPPPTRTVIVTTRQVPIPCAVCERVGSRPDPCDDGEDAAFIECDACDGKGWLMVTETTTTRG